MSDSDIFDYFDVLPQEAFAKGYRDMLRRFEAELDGSAPPQAVAPRDVSRLLSLWSALVQQFESRERRDPRLHRAMEAVEAEIVGMQRAQTLADLTKRRRLQRIRHDAARCDGQPSPIEVWRFVVEQERRDGSPRGSAAAAAKHFNKSRSRIRDLLRIAEDRRRWLENHLAFLTSPRAGRDHASLRSATARLLRKLPARR